MPGFSNKRKFLLEAFTMKWERPVTQEWNDITQAYGINQVDELSKMAMFLLALAAFVGNVIAGILIPPMLVIGTVAPVQLNSVYFPVPPTTTGLARERNIKPSRHRLRCVLLEALERHKQVL